MITENFDKVKQLEVIADNFVFMHYNNDEEKVEEKVYLMGDTLNAVAKVETSDCVSGKGYIVYDEKLGYSFVVDSSLVEMKDLLSVGNVFKFYHTSDPTFIYTAKVLEDKVKVSWNHLGDEGQWLYSIKEVREVLDSYWKIVE